MSKRKIKTFHQLVEEYKKEIAKNPKEMEVIYDQDRPQTREPPFGNV
jgi:hypothetical protein